MDLLSKLNPNQPKKIARYESLGGYGARELLLQLMAPKGTEFILNLVQNATAGIVR